MRRINLDIVLGVLIGIAVCLLFASPWHWEHGLLNKEFVVGVLSLAGAAGAILAVMRQVAQAQEIENERRRRREYAARKMLPHALSSLARYSEASIAALREACPDARFPEGNDATLDLTKLETPPISDLDIEPIKLLLEFGERDIQDRLAELMRLLQAQQSRLRYRLHHPGDRHWLYCLLADAIEIHARVNMLFPYTGNDRAPCTPGLGDFHNSSGVCNLLNSEWRSLQQEVWSNLA